MKAERWEQIEKLYNAALECEPGDRAAYLQEACGGDDELRRQVESLLAHDANTTSLLDSPALHSTKTTATTGQGGSLIGRRIGSYQVLEQIGAGGMGEVYRAHDTKLKRELALKFLPDQFAHDRERVARFRREVSIWANRNEILPRVKSRSCAESGPYEPGEIN